MQEQPLEDKESLEQFILNSYDHPEIDTTSQRAALYQEAAELLEKRGKVTETHLDWMSTKFRYLEGYDHR